MEALTALDRCDKCGAAAMVIAQLSSGGELFFCAHHFNENDTKLRTLGAVIHDERDLKLQTTKG